MTDFLRGALTVERNHVQFEGQRKGCRKEANFVVTGLVAERRRNLNAVGFKSGCKGHLTLNPDLVPIDGDALVDHLQMQNFRLGKLERAFT